MTDLADELDNWPATGRGDGLDAAVVSKLMKRASAIIRQGQDDEHVMLISDCNDLDDVVHELSIEDSHTTPAEAVRELKAEIERLRAAPQGREALEHLYNEVAGMWTAFEFGLRSEIGNTNYNCVQLRLDEAKAALALTRPFYGAECPSYPACEGGCGLGCTKEIERKMFALTPDGAGESDLCQCPKCGRMHRGLGAGKPPAIISGEPT